MPKELYFFDTINAIKIYDNNIGSLNGNYYHTYNVYYPLKSPLQNVKRITLKSVEMPINLYTLRVDNESCKFGLTFTYSTYTDIYIEFTLAGGVISTVSSLLSIMNTTLNGLLTGYPGVSISFGTIPVLGTTVCSINNNCTSLKIDNTPLSNYILGYTNRYESTNSDALNANSPINLTNLDSSIYIQLPNIPNTNNFNSFTGFKLPIKDTPNNSTLFYNDSEEHQSITFNSTSFIIDKINIVVVDRLNTPLTGYFNWTMSLIIEYDDNNTKQEFLNLEYE